MANAKMGLALNKLVRDGEISAPIVIGRDHLDSGSVASPTVKLKVCKMAVMQLVIGLYLTH